MMDGFEKGMIISFFLFVGLFGYSIFIVEDDVGISFCERMGYDGVSWFNDGSYSEYYGKITCRASFEGEVTTKTYNVDRKFGRFMLGEVDE